MPRAERLARNDHPEEVMPPRGRKEKGKPMHFAVLQRIEQRIDKLAQEMEKLMTLAQDALKAFEGYRDDVKNFIAGQKAKNDDLAAKLAEIQQHAADNHADDETLATLIAEATAAHGDIVSAPPPEAQPVPSSTDAPAGGG
jgi:septal ring factor EnvC (AmiA/AmiB activator)